MEGVPANKSVKSDLITEPPAALPAFTVAPAQVAPLSRHLPWRRRRLRRSLGIYRGIGVGCAALPAFTAASARVAPLSRHLPRHRREFPPVFRHLLEPIGKSVLTGCLQRWIAYVELRSCFEFISENIGRMFLMILFHHLTSIASYVRINDGTKGQKQAPIDPKRKEKAPP